MKKSKLSIGLVAGFVSAMCMSACSPVKKGDKDVISFTGYDGTSIPVVTEDLYAEYAKGSTGVSSFYDKILEVLIRNEFNNPNSTIKTTKGYDQIVSEAESSVKSDKITAKENAKRNGTRYKTEWQSILDSHSVEDEDELREYYIYQLEKEEIEDYYLEEFEDTLKSEFLGVDKKGNAVKSNEIPGNTESAERSIVSRFPYHVSHILVNVSSDTTNYVNGTISEDQATKLYNVVDELANSSSSTIGKFGLIAQRRSEDSGSAANYGDVGIMDNKASTSGSLGMVTEFQLGIYAYDAAIKNASKSTVVSNGLGLTTANKTRILSDFTGKEATTGIQGLTEVPYYVFEELNEYKDATTSPEGYQLANGDETVYPRNILWNKYLNHHNPFIITNRSSLYATDGALEDSIDAEKAAYDSSKPNDFKRNTLSSSFDAKVEATNKTGFRSINNIKGFENVAAPAGMQALCDEEGNLIVGVRSQYGIHFMVINKSPFEYDDPDVSLEEYYTTEIPNSKVTADDEKDYEFPHTYTGGVIKDKKTYVNFLSQIDSSNYSTRADSVSSAIKGFDSTYDYRLYELLYANNKGSIKYTIDGLEETITNYIKLQREQNASEQAEGLELAWDKYFELIEAQNEQRETSKKYVPEGCIIGFKAKGKSSLYNLTGGKCYYGK